MSMTWIIISSSSILTRLIWVTVTVAVITFIHIVIEVSTILITGQHVTIGVMSYYLQFHYHIFTHNLWVTWFAIWSQINNTRRRCKRGNVMMLINLFASAFNLFSLSRNRYGWSEVSEKFIFSTSSDGKCFEGWRKFSTYLFRLVFCVFVLKPQK